MGSLEGCRRYLLFAGLVVGTLAASPNPATAQCAGDALRLCVSDIPDRDRVKSCLLKNLKELTPECRSQFREGQGAVRRRHHRG